MPNNIRLQIHNEKKNETQIIEGRLIGYINDETLTAIVNTDDAARKIFSAETMPYTELSDKLITKQRIVIASGSVPSLRGRAVYVSPPIIYTSWLRGVRRFSCKSEIITVEEIKNDSTKR